MCFLICLCFCKMRRIDLSLPLNIVPHTLMQWWTNVKHIHKYDRRILHPAALLSVCSCFITPCASSHHVEVKRVCLRQGDTFDLSCLSICGWESLMYFLLGFSWRGLKWLEHMLSLSEWLLFWFAPAGDGMEPAWSLSIWAPVDPSEARSSPEMRRHGTDLLFRGYSSPVDKKTIELCCWNNQGWARAVQDGRSAWTETERRGKKTDRKRCLILLIAPGDVLFLWSVLCADEKQRWECCLQSRLLIFPKMFTKSLGSKVRYELRECNCVQVCISGFKHHW